MTTTIDHPLFHDPHPRTLWLAHATTKVACAALLVLTLAVAEPLLPPRAALFTAAVLYAASVVLNAKLTSSAPRSWARSPYGTWRTFDSVFAATVWATFALALHEFAHPDLSMFVLSFFAGMWFIRAALDARQRPWSALSALVVAGLFVALGNSVTIAVYGTTFWALAHFVMWLARRASQHPAP